MNLELIDDHHLVDDQRHQWMGDLIDFAAHKLSLADDTEMSITLVTNDEIQKINASYRQKDRPTDVISFAIEDGNDFPEFEELSEELGIPRNIGDLVISVPFVQQRAQEFEHSFDREFGYTLVHGFLHLNGYDHIDPDDEKLMIGLQEDILTAYGLSR